MYLILPCFSLIPGGFVYEFIIISSLSGGELFDRVASDDYKMSEAEAINYIRQVCDGVKHCHESNIVHLDVKVSCYM